jgi:glycosyltransferase involved in cell wall biosynthesis
MGLVRGVGRLGRYRVTALSTFRDKRVELDGVEYVRIDQSHTVSPPDVHLAYYDTTPLIGSPAKLRIASHHTCNPYHSWIWNDVNVAPCEWAVDHLRRGYRPHGTWKVLPNAVEGLEGVVRNPVPDRVIHHGSPDRGLHLLFKAWPHIKAKVPGATLHVSGDVGEVMAWDQDPKLERCYEARRAREMRSWLEEAERAGGVKLLGKLSRPALLKELSEASCFAFPAETSAPCEVWSISVHECLVLGVPVVLAPIDALASLWQTHHYVPNEMHRPFPPTYESLVPARRQLDHFTSLVVQCLTDQEGTERRVEVGKELVKQYSFDVSAKILDGIVEEWFGTEHDWRAPGPAKEELP